MAERRRQHRLLKFAAAAVALCGLMSAHAAAPSAPRPDAQAQARQVLIASETGTYKDRLVTALTARLTEQKLEVKVIDISGLADVDSGVWSAVVLVHNWEFGEPPAAVREFLARTPDTRRIIDVTTSSSGQEKPEGVDVVTSASVMDEIPTVVAGISARINARLKQEN